MSITTSPYDTGTGKGWNDPVTYADTDQAQNLWPADPSNVGTTLVLANGGTLTLGETGQAMLSADRRINIHLKDLTIRTAVQDWSKPATIKTQDHDGPDPSLIIPGFEWHFDNVRMSNVSLKPNNVETVWMRNLVWESNSCIHGNPVINLSAAHLKHIHSIFKSGDAKFFLSQDAYFNRSRIADTSVEILAFPDLSMFTMLSTDCSPVAGNPLAVGWPNGFEVNGAAKFLIDALSPQPTSFRLQSASANAELVSGTLYTGFSHGQLPGSISWQALGSGNPSQYTVTLNITSGVSSVTWMYGSTDPSTGVTSFGGVFFDWDVPLWATFSTTYPDTTCFALQRQLFNPNTQTWEVHGSINPFSLSGIDPMCHARTVCTTQPASINGDCAFGDPRPGWWEHLPSLVYIFDTIQQTWVLTNRSSISPHRQGRTSPIRYAIYANGTLAGYSSEYTDFWELHLVSDVGTDQTNYNAVFIPEYCSQFHANPCSFNAVVAYSC